MPFIGPLKPNVAKALPIPAINALNQLASSLIRMNKFMSPHAVITRDED